MLQQTYECAVIEQTSFSQQQLIVMLEQLFDSLSSRSFLFVCLKVRDLKYVTFTPQHSSRQLQQLSLFLVKQIS